MKQEIQQGTPVESQPVWQEVVERTPILRRTLRSLPDSMLAALVRSLEKHRHELMPSRLFRDPEGGGCAVGMMLRELDPERYESRSPLRFWLRDRWRRRARSYPELASNPRLRHLEWLFDSSVRDVLGARGPEQRRASTAVGGWILREARAELKWRHAKSDLEQVSSSSRAHPEQRDYAMRPLSEQPEP